MTQTTPLALTDCHFHIYDPTFPVAADAVLTPPAASVEDYQRLQHRLGLTRCVLIQPSTYGTNNDAYLNILTAFGKDRARMVAVVDTTISDGALLRMHDAGVRGLRFNLQFSGPAVLETLEPLSQRIASLGWNSQISMPADRLGEVQELIQRLPGRIVLDHLAMIPPGSVDGAAFGTVQRLIDHGNVWVKLSSPYTGSKFGPPNYRDTSEIAVALINAAPDRMVWGSNWPHPTESPAAKPDDVGLFHLLASWVPSAQVRELILARTPAELYDFPSR